MLNRNILYVLLFLLLLAITRNNAGCQDNHIENKPSTPNVIEVIPEEKIIKPDLKNHIIYDDYDKAISLSNEYKRKVLVVFGAEWCPYCEILKKDIPEIKKLQKHIICLIDTDNKASNQVVINKYRPKNLPTSILIDKEKEISRKIGYRKKDYLLWLDSVM